MLTLFTWRLSWSLCPSNWSYWNNCRNNSCTFFAKEQSVYNESNKEKVALDGCLQLIIIELMDLSMFGNIIIFESARRMWDHIEVLCEGIEEVRENKRQILVSQYEAFMARPKDGIIEVFKIFNNFMGSITATKSWTISFSWQFQTSLNIELTFLEKAI